MNAAMMACVACKDIDRALALYDEMVKPDGCGVDNVTYGTLLKVRNRKRRIDKHRKQDAEHVGLDGAYLEL